jgi:putative ABC transport system permease protein
MPSMQVLRVPAGEVLKSFSWSAGGRRSRGLRVLVAVQVGASLVLLVAASMISSAFHRVLTAQDALDPKGLFDAFVDIGSARRDRPQQLAYYRSLLDHAATDRSVVAATLTSTIPPFQWADHATIFRRGEEPARSALVGHELDLGYHVSAVVISEDFFRVMRVPVVEGREFTAQDDDSAPHVTILSRRLADTLWPGQNPIGGFVAWPAVTGAPRPPLEVVGVARDTQDLESGGAPLALYVPFAQQPGRNLALAVRTANDRPFVTADFVRLGASVDPDVNIRGGQTLRDRLESEMAPEHTASVWIAVFGSIALLLAAIGLYGVIAQSVSQRRREFAMRSALGALPRDILAMVLAEGLRVSVLGAVAGVIGSCAAFRLLGSLDAHVGVGDVPAGFVALGTLMVAVVAATAIPAWRAAAADPVRVLRSE